MKIGIIGTGMVGSAVAFSITSEGLADKLILIDTDKLRATAEAMDISHAAPFSLGTLITSGDYPDLKGSDIVIITAGANQKAGETRLDLLSKNVAIFKQIIPEVVKYAPDAILLIATNPVDVMTEVTLKLSGFDKNRVIGTGTVLDSARFRSILGRHLGISPKSIHANVIGEHGDSEVLLWAGAVAGTTPVEQIAKQLNLPLDERIKNKIDDEVRNAAYAIIEGKGATYYGIATCTAQILNCILNDEMRVLPVSSYDEFSGTSFGFPSVVGRKGVIRRLDLKISENEGVDLQKSINALKKAIESVKI
jgi:L-lactate dehydrogenase